jgi:hypothetical protein
MGKIMSIEKAVGAGILGNELSKKITGTSEVSAGRSFVAAGAGAATGAVAGGTVAVAAAALGAASAPITVPIVVGSALVSLVASFWD